MFYINLGIFGEAWVNLKMAKMHLYCSELNLKSLSFLPGQLYCVVSVYMCSPNEDLTVLFFLCIFSIILDHFWTVCSVQRIVKYQCFILPYI